MKDDLKAILIALRDACKEADIVPEHGILIENACKIFISQQISRDRKGSGSHSLSPPVPAPAGPFGLPASSSATTHTDVPASDKQMRFMAKLGLPVPPSITMTEANKAISAAVEAKKARGAQ